MSNRQLSRLCIAIVGVAALAACPPLSAQQYPTKPVKIVVPFPPGGVSDVIGRFIAQRLTIALGRQVIVENKPGAGGLIGTEAGIRSPADGYTLTQITSSYTAHPSLYQLKFDPVSDITPIIQLSQGPLLIVVHPSVPVTNTRELIALAKERPGKLNFASAGQGTPSHLATELFASVTGVKMNHVPYKGGGPAVTDTIAGHTDLYFGPMASVLPHVRAGKLRAIAVTSSQRVPAVRDVPTVAELGPPGYDAVLWLGLVGPKGLPRPIVDRINSEVAVVLKSPETSERLKADGAVPAGGTPEQFLATIKKEIEVWRKIVREVGVKPE
ncbi:MAG TPA: tripartite tricarboxylate transporter substrate binding protein [Burkholderiales bacterium]|nr:tripartite tricarboxylate transporter substrate binding protein [Burkholderiales bacterium]